MQSIILPPRMAIFFLFLSFSAAIHAQVHTLRYNTPVGTNCNGFFEYLPQGYNPSGTQTYPLIISVHGLGDAGNGGTSDLTKLYNAGIPKVVNNGQFPVSFTAGGQQHKFIIIAPQFISWPTAEQVDTVISYAVSNYKVNISRIYLTGYSMGGGLTWEYGGRSAIWANRVAAIVPICGATYPDYGRGRTIANANLPVWATHNNADGVVPVSNTDSYVSYVNDNPAPNPNAKKTIFSSTTHDAWTTTYDPAYRENGLNVYEWMLQFQRAAGVLPVTLVSYSATKSANGAITISWTTRNENNNSHFTIERSADGVNFTLLNTIPAQNRDHNYSYTDQQPLSSGNYYRLSQTDVGGRTTYYSILLVKMNGNAKSISISPNPSINTFQLCLPSEEKEIIKASIYSANGTLLRQWTIQKQQGAYIEPVPVASLARGTYLLRLEGSETKETVPFIKH